MNNKLRQRILSELRVVLNEEEYAGVAYQTDPSIQRLVGGNGTPQDILAFVKSQADSYYINDDEAKLMKDSVVSATAKCSKQQLSQEELAWCQEYKTLAPQILKTINFKWGTYTGTQGAMRAEFNKALGQAEKLSLSAGQASPTPAPAPTPPSDAFSGKSFQCNPGTVAQFQNWLKKQGQAICADDKFGQRTFAAAKALGNAKLDFSMYNSLDDFKDQAKKDQLCNAIAGDSRWGSESSTPEVCGRGGGGGKRKTSADTKLIPGMKPATSTAGFVDVNVKPQELINLGYTGQFIKADSAIPDSQMQKVSIDPKLLTVLEKGKDYQQLEESKNFYDNKKLIEAKSLFNKLTKSLI